MNEPMLFDSVYHALVQVSTEPQEALRRMDRFQRRIIDSNDLVLMSQDLLDAHALALLTPDYTGAAVHCIRQGLCTVSGSRWLH